MTEHIIPACSFKWMRVFVAPLLDDDDLLKSVFEFPLFQRQRGCQQVEGHEVVIILYFA